MLKSADGLTSFICDNGSTDHTVEFALASGAQVHHEALRGKGNAVRRIPTPLALIHQLRQRFAETGCSD
jgi:hypothetical protein